MRPKTNSAATRDTVRALLEQDRLGPEHAALVQLAISTGRALDAALADTSGKKYGTAACARAHALALDNLLRVSEPASTDAFTAFVEALSTPSRYDDPRPPGFDDVYGPRSGNGSDAIAR
jgi:hypothetical protein